MKAFLSLYFLLTSSLLAANQYDFTKDRKWLNLHRYVKQGSKLESLVKNQNWFFSQLGRTSPQDEGLAAIKSFKANPKLRCLFPARVRHLKNLNLLKEENIHCPQLDYLKKKLKLQQVSLVFASYHVNNPSSAFGHTLFKLKGSDQDSEYLNWGLNFSALQTTKNPLLYGLYGLTGGFKGRFSLLPYFIKLKEYQDNENRDLWEYQLDLSEEQLESFVYHLWEMNSAEFDYYYLTKNCSYHLLAFLDAIEPQWNLAERLPYFIIPSETLKVVAKTQVEGRALLVQNLYKPSPFKRLKKSIEQRPKREKDILKKSFDSLGSKKALPQQDYNHLSTKSIDLLIDLFDYSSEKNLSNPSATKKSEKLIKEKRRIQLIRAQRPMKEKNLKPSQLKKSLSPPHSIHPSFYISLGRARNEFKENLVNFKLRASFDEYLDRSIGDQKWTQLILGKLSFNYYQDQRKLRLDRFTLLNVEANNQNLFSSWGSSWSILITAQDRALTPTYDIGPAVTTSYGLNYHYKSSLLKFYIPLQINWAKRSQETFHQRNFSYDARLVTEFLHRINPDTNFILSQALWYHSLLETKVRFLTQFKLRWHFLSNSALDLGTVYRLNRAEYRLSFIQYF